MQTTLRVVDMVAFGRSNMKGAALPDDFDFEEWVKKYIRDEEV